MSGIAAKLREQREMGLHGPIVDAMDAGAAEIERLRQGITDFIEGNYERPIGEVFRADGTPSKHDKCVHALWLYEECDACACEHFERVLAPQPTP